jgi:hypothetical protein
MTHSSGQAGARIQKVIDFICETLSRCELLVKYICADGDTGENEPYKAVLTVWYSILIEQRLLATLAFASESNLILVLDYLHLWKMHCGKVENCPVTLSSDSLEAFVNAM